jgi:tRNA-Thr(GGU) m(6)t(6)A37 methyltransferase TsaA
MQNKANKTSLDNKVEFNYIGQVHSPYKEKFAIPRQPGLVSAAKGNITLTGDANNPELIRELAEFSHIWVLFVFHGTQEQGWKPLVRPPRLGGNKKIGVLATRSTFRPNPIGMSVVKLESIAIEEKQVILHISGIDLLDQTPIIDIKPYVPYSDSLPTAQAGFAQSPPEISLSVTFSDIAKQSLIEEAKEYPELANLITQVLCQDPRPAYKQNKLDTKLYGMRLYDFNIVWKMQSLSCLLVTEIVKQTSFNDDVTEKE